jgi:hypothetical protein
MSLSDTVSSISRSVSEAGQAALSRAQDIGRSMQVAAAVETTARFADSAHGDPVSAINETMSDPNLSAAQKDEYVARVAEMATGTGINADRLDARATGELVTALEDVGVAYTGPATPELREQVTASMGRLVDSGRITPDQVFGLVDPKTNFASDGIRQLLSTVTNGAALQDVSLRLQTGAAQDGYSLSSDLGARGLQGLMAAADLAGMAADNGFYAAANRVVAEISANPSTITDMSKLMMNAYGTTPAGRSGFDAVASAVAGTNRPADPAQVDAVFSAMVDASADRLVGYDRSAGLSDLGQYFNANITRLNTETTFAGANSSTAYASLTERFMGNVMLNSDFSGGAATRSAISAEMARLGNIVGAPNGNLAPNEAQRTESAMQFGTLVGSLEGATSNYIATTRDTADRQIATIRTVSDLVTGGVLGKAGPMGKAFGGKLVDSFWDSVGDRATARATATVDAAMGDLQSVGQAVDSAMTKALRTSFPSETFTQTNVNGPGIVSDYQSTADIHRTNASE